MSLKKTQHQKKFFFIAGAKTAESFEGLNSSVAQSSAEMFPLKNT